jgi:hypothetical protein
VSVNGGLAFVSAGVTVSGQISSPIVSATAAKPPVEGDTDPEFIENSPIIFPATNPNNPPSDNAVNSTITAQQYVSLRSVALSHTGKQLHCTWKCDTPSTNKGTGQGTYSYATAMTGSVATAAGGIMEWDQAGNSGSGAYVCQWQWRPPIDAQPADTYDLYCEVSNYDSPKVKASIKNRVTIVPPGVILYETDRNDSGGRAGIWSMNPDGGSRKCYVAGATQPSADLHQTRVVFMRSGQIQMLSPSDPTHPLVLRDTGTLSAPSISPTGNRIAFRDGNNIMVANVAKNAPATVVVSVPVNINVYPWSNARPGTEKFTWSPDGNTMACCSGTDITKYTIANNGLGDPIVTGSSAAATATSQWPLWSPSWKADGSQIYYEINGVEGVYDPYLHLTRAGADWLEFSPLLEETLPERDPNIAAANEQMLEVVKPVTSPFAKVNVGENTNDDGQIYLVC